MSKNSEQPAFPQSKLDRSGTIAVIENSGGLTKREIFAKAAMQAIISNPGFSLSTIIFDKEKLGTHSVIIADEVIKKLGEIK